VRNNKTVQIIDIIKDDYQNFPQQTYSIYAEDVYFEDPLNKFTGLERYKKMIGFLGTFFQDINLELHDISQQDRDITIEWTLNMTSPLPWKPRLAIPGNTELKLNDENLIIVHCDRWKISRWQVLLQNFSRN
jgi:hypothetical protein